MRWVKRLLIAIVVLIVVAAVLFFTFAPAYTERQRNGVIPHDPYPVSETTQTLHQSLVIGDWHADSLLWKRDLLERGDRGHTDIPRLIEGNVAVQVYTAVTKSPSGLNYEHNSAHSRDNITLLAIGQLWPMRTWTSIFERAIYQAEKLHDFEARDPERVKIIKTKADLEDVLARKLAGEETVGFILGIEGAHPIENDFSNLLKIVDAGYRLIALQHFFDNEVGGSLHGESNNGLTDLGRQVARHVAENNLILDVSHSSEQVVNDVLDMNLGIPIVVSHTGTKGHCDTERNISDDLMKRIAETGGVLGIGYWDAAICDPSPAGIAEAIKAAIDLVGEDHVSLGSDFDGSVTIPFDASELAALTQALVDIGMPEIQIRKVMGENMMRVLRERLP